MKRFYLLLFFALVLGVPLAGQVCGETLTLPAGVTDVQEEAFYQDAAIGKVILPDGVQTIGARAFARSGVTEINLPDSLKTIADDAFDETALTKVTAKEGTYAYEWAFSHYYIGWAWEELLDGTVEITGYSGRNSIVTFPARLGGKRVSGIADGAFAGSGCFMEITIPGTIDRIGNGAFAGSGTLKKVTVQQGVKIIGSEAFCDCPKLETVVLPQSGVTLGSKLFLYCTSLQTVNLPEGIVEVPYQCFWDCQTLGTIVIPAGTAGISDGAFYNCVLLTSVTVPDSLVSIGKNSFHACGRLETITLPAGVSSIHETAFSDCSWLVLTAPEGSYAAQYGLDHQLVPENAVLESAHPYSDSGEWTYTCPEDAAGMVVTFSERCKFETMFEDVLHVIDANGRDQEFTDDRLAGKVLLLPGKTFRISLEANVNRDSFGFRVTSVVPLTREQYEARLAEIAANPWETKVVFGTLSITGYRGFETEITIPSHINGVSVASVGEDAFSLNKSLRKVTIEEGIREIGPSAFYSCTSLTEISLPTSLQSIRSSAFYGCTGLAEISLPSTLQEIEKCSFYGCSALTSISFPEGLEALPESVMQGCTALSQVNLPTSMTTIGLRAFKDCLALKSIVLPGNITTIQKSAFSASGLESFTFPDTFTTVPDSIFTDCENLKTVHLPGALKEIQSSAFQECRSLETITLPAGLETIGIYAFSDSALKEITFPEGLKNVGKQAFASTGLTRVFIPASLTVLDPTAFSGANSLNEITFAEDHPNYMSRDRLIYDKTGTKLISCVPALSGEVLVPEGVTTIGSEAFSNRSLITSVVLPASVTEMEGSATFEACTNLTSVEIRGQITFLPHGCFFNCKKLTSLSLPGTVTRIGQEALAMSGLHAFTLPPLVKSLEDSTFYGCPDLETIILPNGVTSLGYNAISRNPKLTSVTIPASVTSIDESNFEECPLAVIRTPKNSYAWIWAGEHHISVEELA